MRQTRRVDTADSGNGPARDPGNSGEATRPEHAATRASTSAEPSVGGVAARGAPAATDSSAPRASDTQHGGSAVTGAGAGRESEKPQPTRPLTARQRAREQVTAEILAAARTRLRDDGPAQLSLRAVARDVGMVSSAVYRYFASRDELLTALLTESYNELGAVAEDADAAVADRSDSATRWMVVSRAIREWALQHPGDYALLFGTPVPGYAAPDATIEPAKRVIIVLIRIVADAYDADPSRAPVPPPPGMFGAASEIGPAVTAARASLENAGFGAVAADGADGLARLLMAWSSIFGALSFEIFGHFVGSVTDNATYFDHAVHRLAVDLGIA